MFGSFNIQNPSRNIGNRLHKSGLGFFGGMDLGIVRRFFEIGAGDATFEWAD